MEKINFKFVDHTADIKFLAYGNSIEETFRSSALALSEYVTKGKKIKKIKKKKLKVEANDIKGLLYGFLDELIFFLDAEDFIIADVKINKINDKKLEAIVIGDKASKYKKLVHIKAATYAEMHVKQGKDKNWEAQVVLDV